MIHTVDPSPCPNGLRSFMPNPVYPGVALCSRLFLMVAVGNLLLTLLPQLLVLLPDLQKEAAVVSPALPFSDMVHRPFSKEMRIQMREEARKMFYWGYDNYINHAFPFDELNPINCTGRGHDWKDV